MHIHKYLGKLRVYVYTCTYVTYVYIYHYLSVFILTCSSITASPTLRAKLLLLQKKVCPRVFELSALKHWLHQTERWWRMKVWECWRLCQNGRKSINRRAGNADTSVLIYSNLMKHSSHCPMPDYVALGSPPSKNFFTNGQRQGLLSTTPMCVCGSILLILAKTWLGFWYRWIEPRVFHRPRLKISSDNLVLCKGSTEGPEWGTGKQAVFQAPRSCKDIRQQFRGHAA